MLSRNTNNASEIFASDIMYQFQTILDEYRNITETLIQPYGISSGQPPVLMLICQHEGISQKDIAGYIGVKPSSVTTMMDRMVKAGLVIRKKDGKDQRMSRIFLTEKGRVASKKMMAIINFINQRNLAGFRDEEKILLLRLLEHMRRNLANGKAELSVVRENRKG